MSARAPITTVADLRTALADAAALLETADRAMTVVGVNHLPDEGDERYTDTEGWLLLFDEISSAASAANRCRILARAERAS